MKTIWDGVLRKYIHSLISPDERNKFESTPDLVRLILEKAEIKKNDLVVDIGCGWGNITRPCTHKTEKTVVGIEPNLNNLKEATKRSVGDNTRYIEGAFEKLNYDGQADVIISSLAFHQIPQQHRAVAINNIGNILKISGRFVLCDTMIMFDPESDPVLFNEVYRYLLEKTVPPDIFATHIEPYLQNNHIYTWEEMKEFTPEDSWFYSKNDLKEWVSQSNMKIIDVIELCPFFGIITIEKI